jgi:hypothetical protein
MLLAHEASGKKMHSRVRRCRCVVRRKKGAAAAEKAMGASERQQKEDWIGGGRKIGSVAGAAEGKSKTNLALISG